MSESIVDPLVFAAGAFLIAAAVRWWRPELPRRWIAGHALLVFAFFAVPLVTPLAQAPVDIAYRSRPWSETLESAIRPDNPLLSDIPRQMLPFHVLVRERWLAFEAPLWAHEMGAGQPLLGNAQSAPFAPLHLMALPVPPLRGLTLAAAWQMLLGLLLMHALVLALARGRSGGAAPWPVQAGAALGAVAFALSTYAVVWLYHPNSMTAAWIPGLLLGIVALHRGEARAFPGLVAAAVGVAVSGHPETTAQAALAAVGVGGALLLARPHVGRGPFVLRSAGAAALAACLAAPALLPVIQVLPESERAVILATGGEKGLHSPPFEARVLEPLVDPLAFGSPRDGDWSGPTNFNEYCSQYAGAAVLAVAAAAVVALGSWRLALILSGGLVALLGAFKVPGAFDLFEVLPLLSDSPHARLRLLWVVAVALVAGLGAPRLAGARSGPLAGTLALTASAVALAGFPPPFGGAHQRLWWGVVLAGLAASAAALAWPRWRPAFPAILLAATVADLFVLGVHYHARVPPGRQLEAPPALAWLGSRSHEAEAAGRPFRVIGEDADLSANLPAVYGLWSPLSYDAMHPYAVRSIVGPRLGAGRWKRGTSDRLSAPLDVAALRMLDVRYVLTRHRRELPAPWEPVANEVGGRIWRLPEALDLFFVPERVRTVAEPELARAITLRNQDFARLAVVVDPAPAAAHRRGERQDGSVWLRRVRANGFDLVTRSDGGAVVASSVSQVSGWRARIDGEPGEVVTVNGGFVGVRVPAGVHGVELTYAPAGWRWGWALFGGAIAAMLLAAGLRLSRRGAARRPAGSEAP